jgi:hypothetical protein
MEEKIMKFKKTEELSHTEKQLLAKAKEVAEEKFEKMINRITLVIAVLGLITFILVLILLPAGVIQIIIAASLLVLGIFFYVPIFKNDTTTKSWVSRGVSQYYHRRDEIILETIKRKINRYQSKLTEWRDYQPQMLKDEIFILKAIISRYGETLRLDPTPPNGQSDILRMVTEEKLEIYCQNIRDQISRVDKIFNVKDSLFTEEGITLWGVTHNIIMGTGMIRCWGLQRDLLTETINEWGDDAPKKFAQIISTRINILEELKNKYQEKNNEKILWQ